MQDTTVLSCFALPIRLTKIYKFDSTLCIQDLGKGSLCIMGRTVTWYNLSEGQFGRFTVELMKHKLHLHRPLLRP